MTILVSGAVDVSVASSIAARGDNGPCLPDPAARSAPATNMDVIGSPMSGATTQMPSSVSTYAARAGGPPVLWSRPDHRHAPPL